MGIKDKVVLRQSFCRCLFRKINEIQRRMGQLRGGKNTVLADLFDPAVPAVHSGVPDIIIVFEQRGFGSIFCAGDLLQMRQLFRNGAYLSKPSVFAS